MKTALINVRIPINLKKQLEDYSAEENITLSEHIREIITAHFMESEELIFINAAEFYNSNQFIYLITWMMLKRDSPYDSNAVEVFEHLKAITIKAIKCDYFPDELKQEFAKLLVDLSRFINEFGTANNFFRFALPNYSESFNFNILINFIYQRTH